MNKLKSTLESIFPNDDISAQGSNFLLDLALRVGKFKGDLNNLVKLYINDLVPSEAFSCCTGRVVVYDEYRIDGEIFDGAWPGSLVLPFELIPFAGTISGNQVCACISSGRVILIDHSFINENSVTLWRGDGKRLRSSPLTRESIDEGFPIAGSDITDFLKSTDPRVSLRRYLRNFDSIFPTANLLSRKLSFFKSFSNSNVL